MTDSTRQAQTYLGEIKDLPVNGIFVFGSNTQGRHGKGAALTALRKFGARYGQAIGKQGRSYAIVTKDLTKRHHPSVPAYQIMEQVARLYKYAWACPLLRFYVAYSGAGTYLNGYTPLQMAQIFRDASPHIPENIVFEFNFYQLIKGL